MEYQETIRFDQLVNKPNSFNKQINIDSLLAKFDLDQKFGPCIGIPRLQRYQRAMQLGLKPPQELEQFIYDSQYQKCIFDKAD